MDYIAGGLFLLDVIILASFLIFQPDFSDKRALTIYNVTMISLSAFLSGIFLLWMKNTYAQTIYKDMWLFMGLCGSFLIFLVLLITAFLVRLWMFRTKSKNHFAGW